MELSPESYARKLDHEADHEADHEPRFRKGIETRLRKGIEGRDC
jgi:hypothetical protein